MTLAEERMAIKVSIVEDNDQLRGTLARVLARAEGFECVGQHPSAEVALEGIPRERPDVVLMDINLPGMNGVECVRRLKALLPQTQIVMLTVYEDTDNIFNALAAGATGYLLKRTPREELLEAIREVHRGGSPMSAHIARKVVQSFQRPAPHAPSSAPATPVAPAGATAASAEASAQASDLSPREREVLDLL
ncbi:MAG: response regulator transcription factor, partial [Verrucomicrobiales bacterium]|nr:response regulator transcription factor [Verrucomicrobiales bacterium]